MPWRTSQDLLLHPCGAATAVPTARSDSAETYGVFACGLVALGAMAPTSSSVTVNSVASPRIRMNRLDMEDGSFLDHAELPGRGRSTPGKLAAPPAERRSERLARPPRPTAGHKSSPIHRPPIDPEPGTRGREKGQAGRHARHGPKSRNEGLRDRSTNRRGLLGPQARWGLGRRELFAAREDLGADRGTDRQRRNPPLQLRVEDSGEEHPEERDRQETRDSRDRIVDPGCD